MEAQTDFKESLELLNANHVEYVIVGAYALAYHGVPRFTGAIDILVKPSPVNAQRILSAIVDFGFGALNLKADDFQKADCVIELGVPPVRIDIMTSLTGVTWEEADQGKVTGLYGDVPVHFLGKKQIIVNKRATGRKKDYADLEALGEE